MKIAQQQSDAQMQIASLKSQLAQKESELAAVLVSAEPSAASFPPEISRPPAPELVEALKRGPRKTTNREA